jgi:hypothetical protein
MMPPELQMLARRLGLQPIAAARRVTRYDPVMRFEFSASPPGGYVLHRMSYRGEGGWLFLRAGKLKDLAGHLAVLGTDTFFELY